MPLRWMLISAFALSLVCPAESHAQDPVDAPAAEPSPPPVDPWGEGWTQGQREAFVMGPIIMLFLGTPAYLGTAIVASYGVADPCSSPDCETWAALTAIPAAGPWIRLLDPAIDRWAGPVIMAVANTVFITALVSAISMLIHGAEIRSRRASLPAEH